MRKPLVVVLLLACAGCAPSPAPMMVMPAEQPLRGYGVVERSLDSCASYRANLAVWNSCMAEARRFHDPDAAHGRVDPYMRASRDIAKAAMILELLDRPY